MGMHSLYQHFPIECRFEQRVHTGYKWGKGWICRGKYPFLWEIPPGWGKGKIQAYIDNLRSKGVDNKPEDVEDVLKADDSLEYSTYNAFETADLIPSLCRLVRDVRQGRNKKAAIKKWVSQYGFLGVHVNADGHIPSWESLADFWRGAEILANLWDKFRQVTQRDLDGMREWIVFEDIDEVDKLLFGINYNTRACRPCDALKNGVRSSSIYDLYFTDSLEEINRDPLNYYQVAGLHCILVEIEKKLFNVGLSYTGLEKISNPHDDIFKLRPVIKPRNLLQAMYLQFYILLCGHNVKVCKWCEKPFRLDLGNPYSKDRRSKEYCSLTCKHSAKSRRYRERQKLKAFLKNSST